MQVRLSARYYSDRRGAMLPMIVLLLPMLLVLAAFAINLAHIEATQTEIQVATDAAARASGRVYATTGDRTLAYDAALEALDRNRIGNNQVLHLEESDLTIGVSTRDPSGLYDFTVAPNGNSVRIATEALNSGRGDAVGVILPILGFQSEVRPIIESINTQADIDIAIVIDRSGSMAYAADEVAAYPPAPAAAPQGWDFGMPVPPQSRWLDVIDAVEVFRQALENSPQQELVSLSLYNDTAETVLPLTSDVSQLESALDTVSDRFDSGGTNVGGGLLRGLATLNDPSTARADAAKVVIVLTDGVHNTGTSPFSAARRISNSGVIIFTITFSDEAREADMQRVADIGGGSHFHAITSAALQQAFVDISKQLPGLITK